ncbi:hypothetical protein [Caballeronia grimmiae]|uniref:hypothetical protein n=1 Tax=Caballeronia grimmiae TaxID=1071679 RepID=UPI0038B97750
MTRDDDKQKPKAGKYNDASKQALQRLGKGHHLSDDQYQSFLAFAGQMFCGFLNDQQIGELMLAWKNFQRESEAAQDHHATEGELASVDDAHELTKRLVLAAADHLRR